MSPEAPAVRVRLLCPDDAPTLARLYRANRAYLAPFEPARDEEFFTPAGQQSRVAALLAEHRAGRAHPYVVEVDGEPAGRMTVADVVLGPAPRYLHIAGRWRDHLLFQRLADDEADDDAAGDGDVSG